MLEGFDKDFHRYAELIVRHGLNVQPDQVVHISTEPVHREFALLVAQKCYEHGARLVDFTFHDPRADKLRIEAVDRDSLAFVPPYFVSKFDALVDLEAANLKLIGMEFPDLLANLPADRMQALEIHRRRAMKRFYEDGIGKSKVHWCVAAAATPLWGQKVYPGVDANEAEHRLWGDILAMCRADKPACLDLWKEHNERLHRRAKKLTDMNIQALRFLGSGTDLVVGLSEKAVWRGGQERSARGHWFEPNLPTEEVFTTPDYRTVEGHARTTRPFMINGRQIENLSMKFENGVITDFMASTGAETFAEYIDSDTGAGRLGEVALVGTDSPIFQTGRVFEEILFDENAACHIAVGMAYKFCLDGGETMSTEALAEVGCNESAVHTDMMISDEDTDVVATTYAGEEVRLLQGGAWTKEFA